MAQLILAESDIARPNDTANIPDSAEQKAAFWHIVEAYSHFYRKYQLVCSLRSGDDIEKAARFLSSYLRVPQECIDLHPGGTLRTMLQEFNSQLISSSIGDQYWTMAQSPFPWPVRAWKKTAIDNVSAALHLDAPVPEEDCYQEHARHGAKIDIFSTDDQHVTFRLEADAPHRATRKLAMLLNVFPYSHEVQYLHTDPPDTEIYAWEKSTIGEEIRDVMALLEKYESAGGFDTRIRDWH